MSGADRPSAVRSRISRSRGVSSRVCTLSRTIPAGTVARRRQNDGAWIRTPFSGLTAMPTSRRWPPPTARRPSAGTRTAGEGRRPRGGWPRSTPPTTCCAPGPRTPRAAPPRDPRGAAAARGSWLPDAVRRALGPELLEALADREAVRLVTPASTWASPHAVLAVTERRLLWLLDDAPVARVRSLAFRDVAAVAARAPAAPPRGDAGLRTIAGRRAQLRRPAAAHRGRDRAARARRAAAHRLLSERLKPAPTARTDAPRTCPSSRTRSSPCASASPSARSPPVCSSSPRSASARWAACARPSETLNDRAVGVLGLAAAAATHFGRHRPGDARTTCTSTTASSRPRTRSRCDIDGITEDAREATTRLAARVKGTTAEAKYRAFADAARPLSGARRQRRSSCRARRPSTRSRSASARARCTRRTWPRSATSSTTPATR